MQVEKKIWKLFKACTHARTLRARALSSPPDIGIQLFKLMSCILCEDRLCQLKKNLKICLSVHARTHLACTDPCTAP